MGAYSRNKGNAAEQALARYLRPWWPQACRAVRTGSSAAPDPGDIANVPFVVSCKSVAATTASKPSTWIEWWHELDEMRIGDPAALAFIVEKKPGTGEVGRWWVHCGLADLAALYSGRGVPEAGDRTPVRIALADFVDLLVSAGFARAAA